MFAVVIGNGESRKSVDLQTLSQTNTLIGCNALLRDISVPHLICCDQRMVDEALASPNNQNTVIYTRPEWAKFYSGQVKEVPQLPYKGELRQDLLWHWGSGPLALLVACTLGFRTIQMIGFDLHGINGKVNNVYKDSKNYLTAEANSVDPVYWIYQGAKIFELFPEVNFVVLNTNCWTMPKEWQKNNVKFVAL
jgi:hypothetical protein